MEIVSTSNLVSSETEKSTTAFDWFLVHVLIRHLLWI